MLDDRGNNRFPMPLDAMHQDNVYVGRIRCSVTARCTVIVPCRLQSADCYDMQLLPQQ